jgi:hypothetical protein
MKNLLFVDDEPRILQGLSRQLHSMKAEWEMSFNLSYLASLDLDGKLPQWQRLCDLPKTN